MIALLMACTTPTPNVQTEVPSPPDVPTVVPDSPEPLPDAGTDPLGDAPDPTDAEPTRVRRRMQIHQLDASIQEVTGFSWEINGDNQFEELSASLGVPDFVDRTAPDLEPGLLFQKFLDDAANHVCQELVDAEFGGESSVFLTAVTPEDTSATNPSGVDQTLSDALLRFHGHSVAVGEPQLDSWRFLFDSTMSVTGDDTMAAWRAVCIGLIVHPDFYQY